jgi:lipoprotein signal peptidase
MSEEKLRKQIRSWILFFMVGIFLSGITAFPIESELKFMDSHPRYFPAFLSEWIHTVYTGVKNTNASYSFLSYGTDWLAFAHIIIALLFIGPLRNPVRNKWVIDWAILCCVLVFPLALIAGPVREIPFFHRLIDCSFGLLGSIPLLVVRKKIEVLEELVTAQSL